ncbi:unnamed protein product [Closterium sp. NIES-53]
MSRVVPPVAITRQPQGLGAGGASSRAALRRRSAQLKAVRAVVFLVLLAAFIHLLVTSRSRSASLAAEVLKNLQRGSSANPANVSLISAPSQQQQQSVQKQLLLPNLPRVLPASNLFPADEPAAGVSVPSVLSTREGSSAATTLAAAGIENTTTTDIESTKIAHGPDESSNSSSSTPVLGLGGDREHEVLAPRDLGHEKTRGEETGRGGFVGRVDGDGGAAEEGVRVVDATGEKDAGQGEEREGREREEEGGEGRVGGVAGGRERGGLEGSKRKTKAGREGRKREVKMGDVTEEEKGEGKEDEEGEGRKEGKVQVTDKGKEDEKEERKEDEEREEGKGEVEEGREEEVAARRDDRNDPAEEGGGTKPGLHENATTTTRSEEAGNEGEGGADVDNDEEKDGKIREE